MAPVQIGLFDSGVGGLSVLRAVRELLAGATLHYVADSAHAPYGERDDAFIVERSTRIARYLYERGAQVIVIACNTATAAAVATLRQGFDPLPVVGVEPGLKPALALTRNGRVGVMATSATLRSTRFRALLARLQPTQPIHLQACDGLAAAIEAGDFTSRVLRATVERHCAPVRAFGADTIVLGCTHYPFVRPLIEAALGSVRVVDTSEAVARRVADVCGGASTQDRPDAGSTLLETTGDPAALARFAAAWLPFATTVTGRPVPV